MGTDRRYRSGPWFLFLHRNRVSNAYDNTFCGMNSSFERKEFIESLGHRPLNEIFYRDEAGIHFPIGDLAKNLRNGVTEDDRCPWLKLPKRDLGMRSRRSEGGDRLRLS